MKTNSFVTIDDLTSGRFGGFRKGEIVCLTASAGTGKSVFFDKDLAARITGTARETLEQLKAEIPDFFENLNKEEIK